MRLTDARSNEELRRGTNLLWIDALPESDRGQAYEELKRGEVKVQRLETRDGGQKIRCPGGMIHHWAGAVFIPGATLRDVLRVLQDYDHQAQYYAPDVERSKIESHDDDHFLVFLRFRRHKVITVVLNTQHDVRYFHDSNTREHSRSSAVRIAEVENPGKANEREKPAGEVAHGRARRRSLRAERGGFVDARYSGGFGMADWAVCNEHTEGDPGIYLGGDATSGPAFSLIVIRGTRGFISVVENNYIAENRQGADGAVRIPFFGVIDAIHADHGAGGRMKLLVFVAA